MNSQKNIDKQKAYTMMLADQNIALRNELFYAKSLIRKAMELHLITHMEGIAFCSVCRDSDGDLVLYPCQTLRALGQEE